MWPFSKKISLIDSGMFSGFTDWHSHILPGVDDGVKTMDDSLHVLRRYEELGIKKIWLTPHVMEDYPNTPESLTARYQELLKAYSGKIELKIASENMLDSLFEERILENNVLPIGDNKDHLLVETSYFNPPYGMDDMIESARSKGYTILLAHPERYNYMKEADYYKWRGRGLKFQLNIISLTGGYGETAKKKALWLLKNGFVDVLGSDIHRLRTFNHYAEFPIKKSAEIEILRNVSVTPGV